MGAVCTYGDRDAISISSLLVANDAPPVERDRLVLLLPETALFTVEVLGGAQIRDSEVGVTVT